MLKNKLYSLIVCALVLLTACGEYQKVLNKGTVAEQYKMATNLYENQKFNKAIQLFEKITPSYRSKPQMERIQYMVAQSHYNTKQYSLAAYYFDKFVKNYPKSSKVEEAAYLSAHSYYLSSPVFSLDQKDTQEAISSLQNFIYRYPNSERVVDANSHIKELNLKLEKKSFEIAWQYYHTEDHIAAIIAFDNFLSDHLGTELKEKALYYRFKAANALGIQSVFSKKEERIRNALKYYQRFQRSYPASTYITEMGQLAGVLENELNSVLTLKNGNNGL